MNFRITSVQNIKQGVGGGVLPGGRFSSVAARPMSAVEPQGVAKFQEKDRSSWRRCRRRGHSTEVFILAPPPALSVRSHWWPKNTPCLSSGCTETTAVCPATSTTNLWGGKGHKGGRTVRHKSRCMTSIVYSECQLLL